MTAPTLSRVRAAVSVQVLRLLVALLASVVVLILLTATGEHERVPAYHHYVALGDSYTAAPFVPLTDVAAGCYRSDNNYPHLVAAAMHIDVLDDRSCSGARTSDLTGSQTTATGDQVAPQAEALTADTDLVTVGLGVNNFGLYGRMASQCRKSQRICPLHDERAAFDRIVDQLRPALVESLTLVRERAPKARVLLVGYPRVLPASGDCTRLPRMRPQDRETFRAVNLRVREEMRAAARESDVEFVDFYAASLGHDVCARHPWVQGRIGSSRVGAALHPLPAGQTALARLLVSTLSRPPADSRRATSTSPLQARPPGRPGRRRSVRSSQD